MAHIAKGTDANGNDVLFVEGDIDVQSGGQINFESGSYLKIAGTAVTSDASELNTLDGVTASSSELNILTGVTATKDELNTLDGEPASAGYTIGTEAGGVITVDVQLKDANGDNVTSNVALYVYLAGADTGLTLAAITAAGLAVQGSGDGLFIPNGSDSKIDGQVVFKAGLANLQVTGDAGETYYMVTVLPNKSLSISGAITFAA